MHIEIRDAADEFAGLQSVNIEQLRHAEGHDFTAQQRRSVSLAPPVLAIV
jgi:hypothetical protein